MNYNEWRDELKSNLLGLSEEEKERALQYYAEAYADKRESGMSEKEIINDFGAPYDAAQKILKDRDITPSAASAESDTKATEPEESESGPIVIVEPVPEAENEDVTETVDDSAPATKTDEPEAVKPKKSKKKKIWIPIVSVIACVIAGIIATVTTAGGIFGALIPVRRAEAKKQIVMATYTEAGENLALDMDWDRGEVNIISYDGDKIEIEYPTAPFLRKTFKEKDGKLSIDSERLHFWQWFITPSRLPVATVKIPEDRIMSFDLDLTAGTVNLKIEKFTSLTVDVSAGTLNTENIECGRFAFEESAGAAVIKEVTCTEFLCDMSAGSVTIAKLTTEGNVYMELSAGAVKIGDLECAKLEARLSAGSVAANYIKCGQSKFELSAGSVKIGRHDSNYTDLRLSAGSVELTLEGVTTDYNILVNTDATKCNVNNQVATTGDRILNIAGSAGSVRVIFDN